MPDRKKGSNSMRSTLFPSLVIIGLTVALSSGADQSQAKETQATASIKMTPELKKDMADMYQKMADCLRTDKTVDQCKQEAKQNCPVVEKTGHCPINEGMGPMMGKQTKRPMGSKEGMDMGKMKDNHPDGGN
jgi:hypothetical protein